MFDFETETHGTLNVLCTFHPAIMGMREGGLQIEPDEPAEVTIDRVYDSNRDTVDLDDLNECREDLEQIANERCHIELEPSEY